jgi:flagellar biosynthesis/type III secretory pathway M-ring protein FliF/YscJ
MESLKRALEQIGRLWTNLGATQRVVLSAAAALMVLLLFWGSSAATPTWTRVAGAEVDASRRATIVKKLQERNQKHEVRGNEIYVPKEDADRVVLELAGEGAMSDNSVWKFLEQSDIFATRWDKEKRFQVALQSRLEGMIRGIESVKNASVVINPGSTNSQLGFAGPKASASVQVELHEGRTLSRKNAQAIAGLVASAVPGVEPGQVHLMDTRGTSYRVSSPNDIGPSIGDLYDYKKRMEEDIEKKIRSAFAFSAASVVVGIKVRSADTHREDIKHGKAGSHRGGGEAGSEGHRDCHASPDQGSRTGRIVEAQGRDTESESSSREKSVVDRSTIQEHNPAGDIERVTIGVIIPVEEGPAFAEAERQLSKLRDFVLKAEAQLRRRTSASSSFPPRSLSRSRPWRNPTAPRGGSPPTGSSSSSAPSRSSPSSSSSA